MCLTFFIIRSILFVFISGENIVKIPASSVFAIPRHKAEVVVEGQVYKKLNTSKNQILYLKNNSLIHDNKSFEESNILIYDDSFSDVPIGKTIKLKGRLTSFEGARNPGNFDQQLYYAKQNIYGFVWCEKIVSVTGTNNQVGEWLYRFRRLWKNNLTEHMNGRNGAVLAAMLLSEKSAIEPDLKEQYQQAGISHVLAISGLHISFIGLGIYRILRKGGLPYLLSGILAMSVLTGYTLMIGFSVSVLRAYLMLLLRIGADIAGRVYDMLTAAMLSAAVLVAYQPLYLTDAAFYLSHGAILGIAIVLPEMKRILPCNRWIQNSCAGIAINVAVFPVLLWFYYEFSLYSIFINLIIIPLMSVVLGLGMFGSLGCFLWEPIGKLLLWGCDLLLTLFDRLSQASCNLPMSHFTFGKPNWWEMVIYYMVLLGVLILSSQGKLKWRRMLGALCVIFSILIFIKFPNGKVKVTMIDVGQGDCIFVKGPKGNTYLIDGGSSDVKQVGKYRMEPFLKSQGVGKLDYVFVSHGDADHYIGIQEMIGRQNEGIRIRNLVLPANYQTDEELKTLAKEAVRQKINVVRIASGEKIREGDLQIQCLQPDTVKTFLEGNDGSMILELKFKKFDMLFTGDVEKEGEQQLLSHITKEYDILKVAHHGSKNSTGEDFLKITRPQIAWISAGKDNSYGHPHEETLYRLQKIGCRVYQTMKYGAITVESDGDFIDIFPSSI